MNADPLRLLDQGWRGLLPVLPADATPARHLPPDKIEEIIKGRGKAPGRHVGDGWTLIADWRGYPDDEETVARWAAWHGGNVGLRAGHGVVFLDADILDADAAGEINALIRRKIGLDALVRIGRAPKVLFPIRVKGTIRSARSAVVMINGQRCMLEVLTEGRQAVIGGIHPDTGKPYTWPLGGLEDIGPEDLPELTAEEVEELVQEASRILLRRGEVVGRTRASLLREGSGPRPLEELRAHNEALALDAAAFVRNNDWTYDDWVSWAYALRGAFGDAGLKLWLEFSRQSAKHTSDAAAEKVWRDATKAEMEGRLGSGAGTILKIARDEGWTPTLRVVEGPAPHYAAEEIGAREATRRLKAAVKRIVRETLPWTRGIGDAPQYGLKAAAGIGKSVAVLEELAERKRALWETPETWVFVPTTKLAEELAEKARGLGLDVQVVRGRDGPAGPEIEGERLCAKHEEAGLVAKAGLPVMPTLCQAKAKNGDDQRCQFYESCRYLAQFRTSGPAVRFFSHEYLFLPLPSGLPKPQLVVIDEAFALKGARHASFGIDRLTSPRVGMKLELEAEIQDVALRVRDLLEKGEDPRTAADAETFARVAQLEGGVEIEAVISPGMKWAEQKKKLASLQRTDRFKLAALWRTLGKGGRQQVELRRNEMVAGEAQDRVHVWWRAALRLPEAPVLLLDGSLDELIARKFFPRLQVETIAVERRAKVVQVIDRTCSRNRLLGFDGADEEEQARTANRLEDVRHLAEVAASTGKKVLLVTYKPAEERLGTIPGVDITHFGALRGVDGFKDHDTVIVAGREQTAPAKAESDARSLFGDDELPLELTGGLRKEVRGYRMRDGRQVGAPVEVHADPRCQAIMEQIRERETEQAIDRLRLVHRERPARVIILSNVVVGVTVDRLVTWQELMPSRLEVAAARFGGVLPLVPKWLAERCPDLWATERAANADIDRMAVSKAHFPNRTSYLGFEPLKLAFYRTATRAGGRPSRALIVKGHPDPEAALAALVGPLAMFEWAEVEEEVEEAEVCVRCAGPAPPGWSVCEAYDRGQPAAAGPPREARYAQPP